MTGRVAVDSPCAERLYAEASRFLPGGVSAAARMNPALGRPFYAARGEGSRIIDVDGRTYIDMNTSFGAALLGYGHPAITAAIHEAADLGVLCAFETEYQSDVANRIAAMVPAAELVRFTNTGTETVWHALAAVRPRSWEEASWGQPVPQLPSPEVTHDASAAQFASKILGQHDILAYQHQRERLGELCGLPGIEVI